MGGSSAAWPVPQRTEIDLVVLLFGADLKSEARMMRDTVLPWVTRLCSEWSLELRVHPRWPKDTAPHDERPDDFAETPIGKLRDLVKDKEVYVFAIIGPAIQDADIALLKFVRNARPGNDWRVRYVFLPRPGGDPEAVRSLFAELWREAGPSGYRKLTKLRTEHDLMQLLGLNREPPPRAIVDENVQFTVYRRSAVRPEVWYPLLAFAHLAERRPDAPPGHPDPLEQVRDLAIQALGEDAGYVRVDAGAGVPREGQLTFVPFVDGVDFNPRSQTFEWQEDVHQQNFRLKARADTVGSVLRGQLTVYLGAFILADIDLTFRVDTSAPPPPTPTAHPVALLGTSTAPTRSSDPELTPVTAVPYQKVFPSYSHKDLAIVRQAEVYGRALGHVYLRDRLALRSGEEWEVRLLKLIDEADIFQLFWSSNSMRSEYVRREYEHALKLGRSGFIRPTYWEVPMPQSTNPRLPPDRLRKLHFHGFYEEPPDEYYGGRQYEQQRPREYVERARQVAEEQARQVAEERVPREAQERREAPGPIRPGWRWVDPWEAQERALRRNRARRTRRLLIVATLAVLVALVVVAFLLRG
jgi:hypothetical protein